MSGRHILLLGIIACAGLIAVHNGQRQVSLCYEIGAQERDLRQVREEIEFMKIRQRALQSPRALTKKAEELNLELGPLANGGRHPDDVAMRDGSRARVGEAPSLPRPRVPALPSVPVAPH
jgi:hypothetical protein